MDLAQLQALVDQQGQVIAQLQQQQQPAQQPAPVQFALSPAQATLGIIDFTTSDGKKIFAAATKPLETKYDGSTENLAIFIKDVQHHVEREGWNQLVTISDQQPVNPTNRNLLSEHRQLTLENVRASAQVYVVANDRAKQDSYMFYTFLRDSLTKDARKQLVTEETQYTFGDFKDGPAYLKCILIKFQVETRATSFHIRQSLSRLTDKIVALEHNIRDFNLYVTEQVGDLSSGGETSTDLIVYLFQAYESVPDEDFKDHIKDERKRYNRGENVTTTALMNSALTKYNEIQQEQKWKAPSEQTQQIIALTAQLAESSKTINTLKKEVSSTRNKSNKKTENKGNQSKKVQGNSKGRKRNGKYEEWHYQTPRPGQTTRYVKGKKYVWCNYHKMWCDHVEDSCEKKKNDEAKNNKSEDKESGNSKGEKKDSKLSYANAILSAIEEEEEEE